MDPITFPAKRNYKKIIWLTGSIVLGLAIAGFVGLYSVGNLKIRDAYCSIQGKTFVYSCHSLGCDVTGGRCEKTTADVNMPCTQNAECSSGLCFPPGIDVFSNPIQPTIASLKEKNPQFITGVCSKVVVSKSCSENHGLVTQKSIQELEMAYQKLQESKNSLRERMNVQSFFGAWFSGDPYNCGIYD